jgi:hypothetical protein
MLTRSAVLSLVAFCSCGAPDDTSKFVGKWVYQAGSAITIDCPGAPTQTLDLSSVPPANQPGYFTFTVKSGEVLHELDARGCRYDWTVSGNVASASNQSCSTFPDGHGGSQVVQLQSATKSTADGESMTVNTHFTNQQGCTITGRGNAHKS